MNNTPDNISPRIMTLLNRRLNELNMTRSDFIRKFHRDHGDELGSRNHLFKIMNGQAILGEHTLLPRIVQTLDLDLDEAIKMVRADKTDKKGWGHVRPNKTVQQIAVIVEGLSKRDQEDVLQFTKMKAHSL